MTALSRRRLGAAFLGLPLFAVGRALADDLADIPNVFISPCGKPFRAKTGAPYPVADWFRQADANHDGRLTREEFVADAAAFFKLIDLNGDGVISPPEVAFYEHKIAPEVLGLRVILSATAPRARLWLAQYLPGQQYQGEQYGPQQTFGDPMGTVDPSGESAPNSTDKAKPYSAAGEGASPYGFFDEPEPVTAADLDFDGLITRANFLKVADTRFTALDKDDRGFLTLAGLPQTPVQKQIDRILAKRR